MSETPFNIAIPDSQLELLSSKLALVSFPDELENSSRDYGVALDDIRRLVARWKGGYDWRTHEARLNETLPQFIRPIEIEGHGRLSIHYIHKRSQRVNAVPLLFVHGWPGSFIEVIKILNGLVNPDSQDSPAFHVVAISLPGFGFSEAPKKRGFGREKYAEVAHKLMVALGYDEYVTQGGDWGQVITNTVAFKYPKHAKAWHINLPLTSPPSFWQSPLSFVKFLFTPLTEQEKEGLARAKQHRLGGQGYFWQQATRPQTLGYSLADSPVGLLAWIYEKLISWTDSYPWDDDEVLTWVSIYIFSRAGPTASLRIYYEYVHSGTDEVLPTSNLLGISYFPKEFASVPAAWFNANSNLVFTSYHTSGGHFAAYERPDDLVGDLRKFFGKFGPAYSIVGGRNGYD